MDAIDASVELPRGHKSGRRAMPAVCRELSLQRQEQLCSVCGPSFDATELTLLAAHRSSDAVAHASGEKGHPKDGVYAYGYSNLGSATAAGCNRPARFLQKVLQWEPFAIAMITN